MPALAKLRDCRRARDAHRVVRDVAEQRVEQRVAARVLARARLALAAGAEGAVAPAAACHVEHGNPSTLVPPEPHATETAASFQAALAALWRL